MDFSDSPEEADYRVRARAWLGENAPLFAPRPGVDREGDPGEDLSRARSWQARKAEGGFAQITWPKAWGGGGGTPLESVIFDQEEAAYGIARGQFTIGLAMCLPTVMAVADEATKQRFVGPAVRGEEIWCQLFSEPSGGSDLAAARTRAVREGDEWVIDGQKIWTSGAHYADFGLLLARTNPATPKHKGMTMFWVDMKSPGVEVRPIHQMSGDSNFNEVFFTGVRISDNQRLGAVDDGWKVSLVTLMNERFAALSIGGIDYSTVIHLARTISTAENAMLKDQALREQMADWFIKSAGLKYTKFRIMTSLSRGQTPGPESAIAKIIAANLLQDLANAAVELEDQFGVISDQALAPLAASFQEALLSAPGMRIAGGTDEILRNIIAERVLGLPGEIRVDKDVPFKDMPTGR